MYLPPSLPCFSYHRSKQRQTNRAVYRAVHLDSPVQLEKLGGKEAKKSERAHRELLQSIYVLPSIRCVNTSKPASIVFASNTHLYLYIQRMDTRFPRSFRVWFYTSATHKGKKTPIDGDKSSSCVYMYTCTDVYKQIYTEIFAYIHSFHLRNTSPLSLLCLHSLSSLLRPQSCEPAGRHGVQWNIRLSRI